MATKLSAWGPEILPEIQEVPYPLIAKTVRDAAIEFCKQTWLWVYTLARINVEADTQDCVMAVPAAQYGEIISIDNVKFKEDGADDDQFRTLSPISENQEDLDSSGSWKFATSTAPSHYFGDNADKTKLSLYPIPTVASDSGLLVRVNLKPTYDCDTLPDFLFTEYRQIIAHGALAELYLKKGMPWYDPQQAGICRAFFMAGWSDGKYSKITGPTKMPLTVKMRPFV